MSDDGQYSFSMDSSDEEAGAEVTEHDSVTSMDVSKDNTWNASSMLVFRERKGLETLTLSEDCQTIHISLDHWALKQMQSHGKPPENVAVVTLTWDKLRRSDSHFYLCEIGFQDESNDSSSKVLLGLCEEKYTALRDLVKTFFKEFRAKVTRVKHYPLSFELAYFSSNGFDELGKRLGEIEDVLKTLCSRCVQSDLSLSVCLHQSEEQDNDEYEDDEEFTMSLCGSETENEDKHSLERSGYVTNNQRTGFLGHGERQASRLHLIEKELQAQRDHFSVRFDEQQSQNEQQQQLLQSLAYSLKVLVERQENEAVPELEEIPNLAQNSSQLEDLTPATRIVRAIAHTNDTNKDRTNELIDRLPNDTPSKDFIPRTETSGNITSEELFQPESYAVKIITQADSYPCDDDKMKEEIQPDSFSLQTRPQGDSYQNNSSIEVKSPIHCYSSSFNGNIQQDVSQGKGTKPKENGQLDSPTHMPTRQASPSLKHISKENQIRDSKSPPLQIRSQTDSYIGMEAKPKEKHPSGFSSITTQGYRNQDNMSNDKENSQSYPATLQLRKQDSYLAKVDKPKCRSQPHPSSLQQNVLPGRNLNNSSNVKENSQDQASPQHLNPQPNYYTGEGARAREKSYTGFPSLQLRPQSDHDLGTSPKVQENSMFSSSPPQLADCIRKTESKANEKVQSNVNSMEHNPNDDRNGGNNRMAQGRRFSDSQPFRLIRQTNKLEKDHSSDEEVESPPHSLNHISSENNSMSLAGKGSHDKMQNGKYSNLPDVSSASISKNKMTEHHIVLQPSHSSGSDDRTKIQHLDNDLAGQNTPKETQEQAKSPDQSLLVSSVLQGHTGGKARNFLANYGVRGTTSGVRRMIETVEAAMKHDANMPPRAKGLNTVLCVDTSDAMGEDGFERMKGAALDFIEGIEDIADKHEMEENLAVVAFGGKSRIVHHLSNDYSSVRIAVENLDFGGNASLFEALLVCLCTLHGRGDLPTIGGIRVHPRIIVLSTGCTVDDIEESVLDEDTLVNNSKDRVVKLLDDFGAIRNEKMFPRPVVWVPFNDNNRKFLEYLSEMEVCELAECDNITQLCTYQRKQEIIGTVYASIKDKMILDDATEVDVDDIINDVKDIAGDLEETDMDDITSDIEQRLEDTLSRTQISPQTLASDFDNIVEFKDQSLPRLGDRVVRGPDWAGGQEDSGGPGTVINHTEGGEEEIKIIWVLWDTGTCRKYRYGYHDVFDVDITRDQPRTTESEMIIHIGCEVTRGRDWSPKYNDQDGGAGGVGFVIRKNDQGRVKVRWSRNGHINVYRYGKDNKLDLRIRDPAECLLVYTAAHDDPADDATSQDGQSKYEPPETPGGWVWQWKADSGDWRLYEEKINNKLEKEYQKRKDGSCIVQKNGNNFRVLFKSNTEKKVDGSYKTDVQRICMSESDQAAMRRLDQQST